MDAKKIHVLFILVTSSKARFTDNCEVFGLKNFIDVKTENSSNNVFCLNATDLTIYEVTILHNSKVIYVPFQIEDSSRFFSGVATPNISDRPNH